MTFTLETYDRKYLDQMCRLYNEETAFEPFIAPLTPELFIQLIEAKSAFDPAGLFIAVEGGKVAGWIQAALGHASESYYDPKPAIPKIQMIQFRRERLDVGNAMVAEATAWLKKSGQTKLLAMHCVNGYPFYRGIWMGGEPMGSTTIPHAQAAFEVGGYKNTHESVYMVARMSGGPPADVPTAEPLRYVDGPAKMAHEAMAESWTGFEPRESSAYLGDVKVGGVGWTLTPQVSGRLGAPAMTIWSLGVNTDQRRKGIGAALTARAMQHSYRAGARFCSLGTQLWNAPAQATYAKLGWYPYCILVGRTLDLEQKGNRQ
jgi:ribosomal protein S18 acetylase RimI-like enzyme